MMMGSMHSMAGGMFLGVFLLFGFAYIVWVLASKEANLTKLTGQIISIVVAVLAVLILLCGIFYGGKMCKMKGGMTGSKDGCMMDGKQMDKTQMMEMMKAHEKMMDKKPK